MTEFVFAFAHHLKNVLTRVPTMTELALAFLVVGIIFFPRLPWEER